MLPKQKDFGIQEELQVQVHVSLDTMLPKQNEFGIQEELHV